METLFRFNMLRKAHQGIDETLRIDLTTDSVFQRQALELPDDNNRMTNLKNLAEDFADSSDFIARKSAVFEGDHWIKFGEQLNTLLEPVLDGDSPSLAEPLREIINGELSPDLSSWLSQSSLLSMERNLKDTILVIKLLPRLHHLDILFLADVLRLLAIVRKANEDSSYPLSQKVLLSWRHQGLLFPSGFLLPKAAPSEDGSSQTDPKENDLKRLADKYGKLTQAIEELKQIKPTAFDNSPRQVSDEMMPPEKFRPKKLFETEFLIRQGVLSQILKNSSGNSSSPTSELTHISDTRDISGDLGKFAIQNLSKEGANFQISNATALSLRGLPGIKPPDFNPSMVLSKEGLKSLSKNTLDILKDYNLDRDRSVVDQLSNLLAQKSAIATEARRLMQPFGKINYQILGNLRIIKKIMPVSGFLSLPPTLLLDFFPGFRRVSGSVPSTHSMIEPAGELDLLIVKQQLIKYSTADIAAVRNIMRGEFNETIKRDLKSEEVEYYRETESTTEEEESVETRDRFEMKQESEKALKEELSAKGSLTVSGKLGPQFEYRAHGEFGWNKTSETATKSASELAREVTQKASEKVTERILSRQRTQTRIEQETTLTQRTSNDSDSHITGIYQWLNKVYQAQVYNYGVREIYDLMIPEPGAMLSAMMNRREANLLDIEEVPALNIQPKDLEPDNYQEYVRLYHVEDISPPPEPFVTVSHNFNSGGGDEPNQRYTHSAKLSIPEGYEAFRASLGAAVTLWDDWGVDVIIGQRSHRFNGGSNVFTTDLDLETDSIPVGMVSLNVADIALTVKIVCRATSRAIELWKLDTYNKIVKAYRLRKSEEEALIAEGSSDMSFSVKGFSNAMNEKLIREEIKRLCISLLTEQHFDHFKAVNPGVAELPELDFDEAEIEGAYVRFFEQAFEWENISWVCYPYFWGQKSHWENKLLMEQSDQQFLDFMKAGYARIVLPIRQGFGSAMDHFRHFGEPWLGGPLPTVSDELYLPIADEIAERLHKPGNEIPVGQAWKVVLPTQLVKLRNDQSLPEWEADDSGEWSES